MESKGDKQESEINGSSRNVSSMIRKEVMYSWYEKYDILLKLTT